MFRVRTVFTGVPGTPWLSTMYFNDTGGTAQQAANAAGGYWGAIDALMGSQVDWATEADVSVINAVTGTLEGVESTTPLTGLGALATELIGFATQALCRWRTGTVVNGRNLRGRTFIPGLTTTSADDGQLISGHRVAIAAAAAALIADANSELVIWHRPNPDTGSLGLAAPVVTGTAWTEFAVMRSRRD